MTNATDFFIHTKTDDSSGIIISQKEDAFVSDVRKFLDSGILPDGKYQMILDIDLK